MLQLPQETKKAIMDYLCWKDRYHLASTCGVLWRNRLSFLFTDELKLNGQNLKHLTQASSTQHSFLATTCVSVAIEGLFDPNATYVLLHTLHRLAIVNVINLQFANDRQRLALLLMLNKNIVGCILKVDGKDMHIWQDCESHIDNNTVALARRRSSTKDTALPAALPTALPTIQPAIDTVFQNAAMKGLDIFRTPPDDARYLQLIKNTMKNERMLRGELQLRTERVRQDDGLCLPPSLVSLLNAYPKYQHSESPLPINLQNVLHNQKKEFLEQQAFRQIADKYMECLVVCGTQWVILTQIDVFVSNSSLDDCAYQVKDLQQDTVVVTIMKKQEGSAVWREVIIQDGRFQILALGGVASTFASGRVTAFLGSSFPVSFNAKNPVVYTREEHAKWRQTYRYLRNYKRVDARLLGSFISSEFEGKQLVAAHPLFYKDTRKSSTTTLAVIGSHIISSYVSARTTREEIEELLELLKKTSVIKNMVGGDGIVATVEEFYDNYEDEIKKAGSLTKAVVMKLCMMEAATGIRSPVNMNVVDDDEGPSLLDIMKGGLASALAAANRVIVKEFTAKYLAAINCTYEYTNE